MPIPESHSSNRPQSLSEVVHERIRLAIINGVLEPGEQLRDEELMAWLGVSRTPLREGLTTLAATGLVTIVPRRGAEVMGIAGNDPVEALRVLGMYQRSVVRKSLFAMTDAQREGIIGTIDDTLDRVVGRDIAAIDAATIDQYHLWADVCASPLLATQFRRAIDELALRIRTDGPTRVIPWDLLGVQLGELRFGVLHRDMTRAVGAMESMHRLEPFGYGMEVADRGIGIRFQM
jgi:DNA-binding GntR family transcriptional regulator